MNELFSGPFVLRAGASYLPGNHGFLSEAWFIPISVGYLISTDQDVHIELGIAKTFMWESDELNHWPGPVIGLRKQDFLKGGAFARIAFTPMFVKDRGEGLKILPYGGLSFGISF